MNMSQMRLIRQNSNAIVNYKDKKTHVQISQQWLELIQGGFKHLLGPLESVQ